MIEPLVQSLQPLRRSLVDHPIYGAIDSPAGLRGFMEIHAFAVWDFMSLLKRLQRDLTCVAVAWTPSAHPEARRLVNEIVLAEESDEDGRGGFASHFEQYLAAMEEVGADTGPITRFVAAVAGGEAIAAALDAADAPEPARAFVRTTMDVVEHGSLPEAAAAFTIGREDLIPDLFRGLVARVADAEPGRFDSFLRYLDRHIEMDGDEHGPMALNLLRSVCGDSPASWAAARSAAERALRARLALWDGVVVAVGTARAPANSGA